MSPVNPAFLAALALFACAATAARAQTPGEVDLSFDSGSESRVNGSIYSVVSAGSGKVYLAGFFSTVCGVSRNRIARLNGNRSLDTDFDPGSGADGAVYSIAVQPDGKVLIGGDFTSYNGVVRNRIVRLNEDGSLDTEFTPGSGANSDVRSIAMQANGKVLIGGEFTSYNGVARGRIARPNANGSLDTGFALGSGTNYGVSSVASQADGKALIGGWFTSNNGVARSSIARLNGGGSPTQASILEAEHPTLGHSPRLQACALLNPLTWRLRAHYLLSSLNAADALTLSTER